MKHTALTVLMACFQCSLGCDSNNQACDKTAECAGGVLDENTGICWQHPSTEGTYSWLEAGHYCNHLELAGHDDWYLPSRDEYLGLFDNCSQQVIDTGWGTCDSCEQSAACRGLFCEEDDGAFWSSFQDFYDVCLVVLDQGVFTAVEADEKHGVRCVRLVPTP
jgi:hypothetical protein